MRYPGWYAIGICCLMVACVKMNWDWLAILIVAVVIVLPAKWDPAIQLKLKQGEKK
jgi:hypothetical protein